jgi:hypothetical protein
MKAIITNDQDDVSNLKLRLVSEGANDKTLMLLLEQQYPIMHRFGDYLEVPIASQETIDLPVAPGGAMELRSDVDVAHTTTVQVKSDPWKYAAIRGATLRISRPSDWLVNLLTVNGRKVLDGDARPGVIKGWMADDMPPVVFNVYPGTIVAITATLSVRASWPCQEGRCPDSVGGRPYTCSCPAPANQALVAHLEAKDQEALALPTSKQILIWVSEHFGSLSSEQVNKIKSVMNAGQIILLSELLRLCRLQSPP